MLSRETSLAFLDEMEKIAGKRTDEVLHALTVSLRKPVTDEHRQAWTRHSALNAGMALSQAKQAITGVAYDGSKAVRKEEAKDALHSLAFTLMPPTHHKPGDLAGMAAKDGGHMDYLRYGAGEIEGPGKTRWRFLDRRGRPASNSWLKKAREEEIASGKPVEDANGDWGTPFRQKESHLHKGGKDGIHFKGTLAEARAELAKAREGKSLLKTAADLTLYHGSPTAGIKEFEPRLDPRTGEKAVFLKDNKESTAAFALLPSRHDSNVDHSTHQGKFTGGKVRFSQQPVDEGYIYEFKVPEGGADQVRSSYLFRSKLKPSAVHKITRQEAEAMGWKFEKKAEYARGLPDKKKTSPVRLVEKPEHWRMVLQSHPAQRAGQHTDLRLNDPAPGGVSHSWATKKDWPKPGERIRLFQQPDHKPSYSDFQGHLLSGYGKTKPGSKGVQKVMDERVEIKRTSDKLIRFDVFRKEGELPDRYVLVKAKHDGKGHPPWVLINHGKAKTDQVPVK